MKKHVLIAIIGIFGILSLMSFHAITTDSATLTWTTNTQNLGKIKQGKPVEVNFSFTNEGDTPLLITNVKTSCGCTATSWPKKAIQPSETSEIVVTYNAATLGHFNKTVKVFNNGENPETTIKITGEVIPE